MKTRGQSVPRARKQGLVVQEMPDELLVYDLDRHKAHCLNQTAAFFGSVAMARRTSSKWFGFWRRIRNLLLTRQWFGWPLINSRRRTCCKALPASGLELPGSPAEKLIRRVGLAAAVSLPIVTSIVAPKATHAINCRTSGQGCTSSAQCCSGVCNAGTCA